MEFDFGVVVLVVFFIGFVSSESHFQPEQVHLAYGAKPTEMTVTWVTLSETSYSIVEYGTSQQSFRMFSANGTSSLFTDGGSEKRKLYMHRATMIDLYPGRKYYYHCGGPQGWSSIFDFTAMRDDPKWSPRLAIYGDLGNDNAQSLGRLQEEVQGNMYDAILHVGDFAYNMDTNQALVGDDFMNQVETVAAYIPYMTCVGNHEQAYNFSNYMSRFTMPGGDGRSMFYSFNMGPAHIIGFSTEFYFYFQYGFLQMIRQYQWLEKDLKEANLPENRAKRPWIITMGHRPMYCSNHDNDDCTKDESKLRKGYLGYFGIEDLFFKYGVDVELWAHEHSYERLLPVYNRTMDKDLRYIVVLQDAFLVRKLGFQGISKICSPYDGSKDLYHNPGAPVQVITGTAGCSEIHDNFGPIAPWTAYRSTDYGYTRMNIYNSTHLYMEQVSDDKGGKVIDKVMVVKDTHGPYKPCLGKQWKYEDYAAEWLAAHKGKKPIPVKRTHKKNWFANRPKKSGSRL